MSKRGMAHMIMFLAVAAVGVASMMMYVNMDTPTGEAARYGYGGPLYIDTPGQIDVNYRTCRAQCFSGNDYYAPYRYETQKCLNECAYWASLPNWKYQQGPSYWYGLGINPDTTQSGAMLTGYFAVPTANRYGGEIKGIMDTESRAFAGRAIEIEPLSCYTCTCGNKYSTSSRQAAEQACSEVCGGTITTETPGACA